MIRFILNENEIKTELPSGTALLDFIRYHQNLCGTKIGCREGDCGACTILIGELKEGELKYSSATSCLMPIGNAHGKHIVTVEGINTEELNPVQQAMADNGATQCGFCTPGFVMSLAGFCLSDKEPTAKNAIAAIDGNICRCTGYKSIEKAATKVADVLKGKNADPIQFVTKNKILPEYFSSIESKLSDISNGQKKSTINNDQLIIVGGGTDLYVQKHDEMTNARINFLFDKSELKGIKQEGNKCVMGSATTVTDLQQSEIFKKYFSNLEEYVKLISSTPIRNMATIAGNFANASPIGDFTIFFLALDAQLVLSDGNQKRELPLRKLYKGYKTLDKKPEEFIEKIWFDLPSANSKFNFEKISKRTNLDIASVNSAISISINNLRIEDASVSAGGVGSVPLHLQKTSEFLKGKQLSEKIIHMAIEIAQTEISPISDARGTAQYKRLLLGQLIKAHFITLFPELE
ncbi:MAG: FAD binding domain-containing protein, partial [Bacteroidota bacterium]